MQITNYLDRRAVCKKTCLSVSTIDRLEKAGDFPKHFLITPRRAVWVADEVDAWMTARRSANIQTDSKPPQAYMRNQEMGVAA